MTWTVVPASRFAQFAPAWHRLQQAGLGAPMLSVDFVVPLLAEFGTGKELLAMYRSDGQIVAMMLLTPLSHWSWSTFQPAQAPLGIWLARPGLDVPALLGELLAALPGWPLQLALTQCDPMLFERPPDGGRVRCLDYVQTSRIVLSGSFDDFWAQRGKNLRANLKKQRGRLQKDGVVPRLEICRAAEQVGAAMADYGRLERTGWKGDAGTAVDTDNAQGRFYRHMLETFCRTGHATIYRYWFGTQVVAMDLCIEDRDCIVILKTSYEQGVAHGLSPSLLMREQACEQLFAAGTYQRIEFYGKVMEWHRRWTDDARTLYHVNYYRWPWLNALHAFITRAKARHAG